MCTCPSVCVSCVCILVCVCVCVCVGVVCGSVSQFYVATSSLRCFLWVFGFLSFGPFRPLCVRRVTPPPPLSAGGAAIHVEAKCPARPARPALCGGASVVAPAAHQKSGFDAPPTKFFWGRVRRSPIGMKLQSSPCSAPVSQSLSNACLLPQ